MSEELRQIAYTVTSGPGDYVRLQIITQSHILGGFSRYLGPSKLLGPGETAGYFDASSGVRLASVHNPQWHPKVAGPTYTAKLYVWGRQKHDNSRTLELHPASLPKVEAAIAEYNRLHAGVKTVCPGTSCNDLAGGTSATSMVGADSESAAQLLT